MILTGNEIRLQQAIGGLDIEDFDEARLGPNSYNLRLAAEMMVYDEIVLDPRRDNRTRRTTIPPEGIKLLPGRVYLARTMEYTRTPGFVPMLEGRSSVGRLGLCVHVTAGFGDIGYEGYWTLELTCQQPVMVYPGMEICQIYYLKPVGMVDRKYSGKYQGARETLPSRLFWEMGGEANDHPGSGRPGTEGADDLREVRPGEQSAGAGEAQVGGQAVPVVRRAGDQPPETVLQPGVPGGGQESASEGDQDPPGQAEIERVVSGLLCCLDGVPGCKGCYREAESGACLARLMEDAANLIQRMAAERRKAAVLLRDLGFCAGDDCSGCRYVEQTRCFSALLEDTQRLIEGMEG